MKNQMNRTNCITVVILLIATIGSWKEVKQLDLIEGRFIFLSMLFLAVIITVTASYDNGGKK